MTTTGLSSRWSTYTVGSIVAFGVTLGLSVMVFGSNDRSPGGEGSLLFYLALGLSVLVTGANLLICIWFRLLRKGGWYGGVMAFLLLPGVPILAGILYYKDDWLQELTTRRQAAVLTALSEGDGPAFERALQACGDACLMGASMYNKLVFHAVAYNRADVLERLLASPAHASLSLLDDAPQLLPRYTKSCRGQEIAIDSLQLAMAQPDLGLLASLLRVASAAEKQMALAYAVVADRVDAMKLVHAAGADAASEVPPGHDPYHGGGQKSFLELAIASQSVQAVGWLLALESSAADSDVRKDKPVIGPGPLRSWTTAATAHEGRTGRLDKWPALLVLLQQRIGRDLEVLAPTTHAQWADWSPIEYALDQGAPLVAQTLADMGFQPPRKSTTRLRDAPHPTYWPCMFQQGGRCGSGGYPVAGDAEEFADVLKDDLQIHEGALALAADSKWLAARATLLARGLPRDAAADQYPCLEQALSTLRPAQ